MGTWGVSKQELVQRLTECLDDIEGDFDSLTLSEALVFMNGYCPTSDSSKRAENLWHKKLKELEDKS